MKNESERMLLLSVLLTLSFLLTGCGLHDADLTRRIPGTWKQEMRAYTNTLTIVPNGAFVYSRITTNIQSTLTYMGTWRISGGRIVLTATNRISDVPLRLGEIFKAKIVQLDDRQWEFEMDAGRSGKFQR